MFLYNVFITTLHSLLYEHKKCTPEQNYRKKHVNCHKKLHYRNRATTDGFWKYCISFLCYLIYFPIKTLAEQFNSWLTKPEYPPLLCGFKNSAVVLDPFLCVSTVCMFVTLAFTNDIKRPLDSGFRHIWPCFAISAAETIWPTSEMTHLALTCIFLYLETLLSSDRRFKSRC